MSSNIYYTPEDFNAVLIGEFELSEPSWSFDTVAVWLDERGQFWVGQDSGCSCPLPFEDIRDLNDLDGPHTRTTLQAALEGIISSGAGWRYPMAKLKRSVQEMMDATDR